MNLKIRARILNQKNLNLDSQDLNPIIMKTKIIVKILSLVPILLLVVSCDDPINPTTNDLSLEVKANIEQAAKKFNATLTRNSVLNLRKETFKNIPNSIFIKNYLSNFDRKEREIMEAVSNDIFFKRVFGEESNTRGLTTIEVPLSETVKEHMLKLNEIIPNAIQSSATSGDLSLDQKSVSTKLIEKFNSYAESVKSDSRLNKVDSDILLMTLEFNKSTIPSIISSLVAAETNSSSGRVSWNWDTFWIVVGVVVATAFAVGLIGSAIGAVIAYTGGLSAAAITAASWSGLYWGAGVGAVGGLIAGVSGYCPDRWFDGGVPLVDWTEDCF